MASKAKKPNRNISRVETGATCGYQVRLKRGSQSWSKLFSDGVWGGKRRALAAAREYRDELEEQTKHLASRKSAALKNKGRTETKRAGVRFVVQYEPESAKGYYEYYVAQWSPEPGTRKTKRFSVNKYGKRRALQLAIAAREQGVNQIKG